MRCQSTEVAEAWEGREESRSRVTAAPVKTVRISKFLECFIYKTFYLTQTIAGVYRIANAEHKLRNGANSSAHAPPRIRQSCQGRKRCGCAKPCPGISRGCPWHCSCAGKSRGLLAQMAGFCRTGDSGQRRLHGSGQLGHRSRRRRSIQIRPALGGCPGKPDGHFYAGDGGPSGCGDG